MGFPVGSRTTVQGPTQSCLTSVFGMGTGDPARYGRPTTNVRPDPKILPRFSGISANPGQDRMNQRAYATFWKQKVEANSIDMTTFRNVRMDVS